MKSKQTNPSNWAYTCYELYKVQSANKYYYDQHLQQSLVLNLTKNYDFLPDDFQKPLLQFSIPGIRMNPGWLQGYKFDQTKEINTINGKNSINLDIQVLESHYLSLCGFSLLLHPDKSAEKWKTSFRLSAMSIFMAHHYKFLYVLIRKPYLCERYRSMRM